MDKMRIGIVCYPTFGGSGVVATELGLEMAALGHSVHFISYSQPVRLDLYAPNIYYHEVVVTDYPLFDYSPYELVLTSKLVSVVKNENLDILHVHYAIPHASAAFMAKKILQSEGIEIPIVCTLHGTDITLVGKDASFEPVITFAINESDAVTAVSQSLKDDTLKFFNINRNIDVIPNFINLDSIPDDVDYGEYQDTWTKSFWLVYYTYLISYRKFYNLENGIQENSVTLNFDRETQNFSNFIYKQYKYLDEKITLYTFQDWGY